MSKAPTVLLRHYVRIPPNIQNWFPGGAPPNWRDVAFNDLTEAGCCMHVETLLPNAGGVRSAVHGNDFYFEIGRDRSRPDTAFLVRIERMTDSRLPRRPPVRFDRTFILLPDGNPPFLDPVNDLFADESPQLVNERPSAPVTPTPQLISRLIASASDTRHQLRPTPTPALLPDVTTFLERLRRIWDALPIGPARDPNPTARVAAARTTEAVRPNAAGTKRSPRRFWIQTAEQCGLRFARKSSGPS